MKWRPTFTKLFFNDRNPSRLIYVLGISALVIITINYYTIKIMSSMRAYIHGESQYSKGERDATQNLIFFLNTQDDKYWQDFLVNIRIPQGDSLAREKLMAGRPEEEIYPAFLAGMNHKEDIHNMIWLFRNFKNISFMKEPIQLWRQGDSLIYKRYLIAKKAKILIATDDQQLARTQLLTEILENTNRLTTKERAFSDSLGETSRVISAYLLYFNIAVTLMIFIFANRYASSILNKLQLRNTELINTNLELDKFVYSASHDLRAPISSLKGLVNISKLEDDLEKRTHYLQLMARTLEKQEEFIVDIIDYSLNKKAAITSAQIQLDNLIDESITAHSYMPGATSIKIEKDYSIRQLWSDPKRLSIIINNLMSNAIKYHDCSKKEQRIKIRTRTMGRSAIIEVEDNGIGIDPKFQPHIFDMFYVANDHGKGCGLGLYITKETVAKLGGEIRVTSYLDIGTTFFVRIPISVA